MNVRGVPELAGETAALEFRVHLQRELMRRRTANAQYSLRAMSMSLDIDHSTLSQIIRGKRAISVKLIESIGLKLRMTKGEIERFVAYQQLAAATTNSGSCELQQLASDTLYLISDTNHYRIMALTRCAEFRTDSRWIAGRLNITIDEVNVAVCRLLRMRLLDMTGRSVWRERELESISNHADFARLAIQVFAERQRKHNVIR